MTSASPAPVETCRADVWLWRARLFKTRALACTFIEGGRVRVRRPGADVVRLDKASRPLRPGDEVLFVIGGRLFDLRVRAAGERRGPPAEAQALYEIRGAGSSKGSHSEEVEAGSAPQA